MELVNFPLRSPSLPQLVSLGYVSSILFCFVSSISFLQIYDSMKRTLLKAEVGLDSTCGKYRTGQMVE